MAASTTRSFSDLPRIMRQRWYFTLAGVLVTLLLCGLAGMAVPVKYQAKAQILVLPPKTSVGTGGNPYLALGGLQAASDVLARAMSDGQTYLQLRSQGMTGTYTVARDLTTSGPILLVAADDATQAGALRTLNSVLAEAAPRLKQLQDSLSVPDNTRLSSNVFTQDNVAAAQRKSQIRAILVAFAAGVFITIMLVSAADSALLRRQRRRSEKRSAEAGAAAAPGRRPGNRRADRPAGDRPARAEAASDEIVATAVEGAGRPAGQSRPQPKRTGNPSRDDATRTERLPSGHSSDQRTSEKQGAEVADEPAPEQTEWSAVTTERAGRRGNG